jgi:hypothetical protein
MEVKIASKMKRLAAVAADWRYMPFYFQRRFMTASVRGRAGSVVARLRPSITEAKAKNPSVERQKDELASTGIAQLGPLLTASQCEDLLTYFKEKPVDDPYRPSSGSFLPLSDLRHRHSHVCYHDATDVLHAPHLLELANRRDVIEIVESYLGCRPTISYLAAWWSYPTELAAQQAENFHRDVDDWRFLKLFVYLTDVDDDSGPHVYVPGSSHDHRLRVIRRYENTEVERVFGRENIRQLTGEAGSAFIEDTFGLHKGQPLRKGHRLMFQAVYSLLPLPYGPRRPVASRSDVPAALAIDPWMNRIYLSSR